LIVPPSLMDVFANTILPETVSHFYLLHLDYKFKRKKRTAGKAGPPSENSTDQNKIAGTLFVYKDSGNIYFLMQMPLRKYSCGLSVIPA
ncbi:hypothetical protein H9X85_12530, partial [Anaerotignum lactatifermentans]